MWDLLLAVALLIGLYQLVALALKRYERLRAMEKLEGEALVAYLGKAEPEGDSLKKTMWWLIRLGSLLLGLGISFCMAPLIECLFLDAKTNLMEAVFAGVICLFGALALIVELIIERKVRG